MMDFQGGWSAGDWILMSTMMVAFWGLLVVGVWALTRNLRRDDRPSNDRDAERLLDERFARGEIEAEDYRLARDLLRSGR